MNAEIKTIAVDRIFPNPHRDIKNYPITKSKVDALVRSITNGDIGLWPSIIVRQVKGGYEMAFGHHRKEAAIKAGLTRVQVIVMDLTDEQMIQYMGRENGEDYGTEFVVLLNTWEAAMRFLGRDTPQKPELIDAARLLGWVTLDGDKEKSTDAARACDAAYRLIIGGHMDRGEFAHMTVATARDIAQRAMSMMTTVEKNAKRDNQPAAKVEWQKKQIGKAAKQTAKAVRGGDVKMKDVRKAVDTNAFTALGKKKDGVPKPLFDRFAYNLCASINAMVSHDPAAARLNEIVSNIQLVKLDVDRAALDSVQGSLVALGKRADGWNGQMRDKRMKNAGSVAVPMIAKRGE